MGRYEQKLISFIYYIYSLYIRIIILCAIVVFCILIQLLRMGRVNLEVGSYQWMICAQ